jgi:pentatricopeptide repeat protein
VCSRVEQAGKQWDAAEAVLETMATRGVRPNPMTYTVLLTGCAQSLRAEAAQRVMARMQADGLEPNAHTLTALVTVYAACGEWRRAVAVFQDVRAGCAVWSQVV